MPSHTVWVWQWICHSNHDDSQWLLEWDIDDISAMMPNIHKLNLKSNNGECCIIISKQI